MASNFGTAARNAAASIVQRRRNPDPDGVIAGQVADRIIRNSSEQINGFIEQARSSMPPPMPQPSSRAFEVASDMAQFNRPAPPPPSFMDTLASNIGGAARGGINDYDIEYIKELTGYQPPYNPDDPFNQPAMPQLGGAGEGPRYERGRAEIGPAALAPGVLPPPLHALMRQHTMYRNFPDTRPPDAKSPLGVYEDGSLGMPRTDPRLWPTPTVFPGRPGVDARGLPMGNIVETGNPAVPANYPTGSSATPFAPAPPPLLPGEPAPFLDPEVAELLRLLGLIQ